MTSVVIMLWLYWVVIVFVVFNPKSVGKWLSTVKDGFEGKE